MASKFIACLETAPGVSETLTDRPTGLDTATDVAEALAVADGWADRSLDWRQEREGVLALWARRPVRGDPATGGRPLPGEAKRTGYTVMANPDVPQ